MHINKSNQTPKLFCNFASHTALILLRSTVLCLILIFLWCTTGFSADGVEWGRFRLIPKLSVAEEYSDNIFLTEKNEEDDYITQISPELTVDFAFAPGSILSLNYKGDFRFYSEFDNFREERHQGGLSWTGTTPKGSSLELGTKVQDSAFQPYSEEDRAKDFVKWDGFADTLFKLGAFTELGLRYDHTSRRFDKSRNAIDEYDRDGITVDIFFPKFPVTVLLLEYSFFHQDNNDLDNLSTDMDTHTVFVGARWEPTAKLSGELKVGYTQTDLEEVNDFSGFATDTDLTYRFSDITTFKLSANRMLSRSTRADRETGSYVVSTGGTLSATYHRWDPLTVTLDFSYTKNDYRQKGLLEEDREDDLFRAGLRTKYFLTDWLSISLSYKYRRNDSDFETVDYKENRVQAGLSLSI
jgi:polysaccharide biosynthesis protein VpsM